MEPPITLSMRSGSASHTAYGMFEDSGPCAVLPEARMMGPDPRSTSRQFISMLRPRT